MGKNSFLLYDDMADPISGLSDEQAGRLIKHIFAYRNNTNGVGKLDSGAEMALTFIKGTLERNEVTYKEKCEVNRSNAIKRWSKEKGVDATEYERLRKMRTYAMDADSDSDSDSDSERELKSKAVDIPYEKVIRMLNQIAGTQYKFHTATTRNFIKARWNEGWQFEDFEKVVKVKTKEWKGTEQAQYLRPQTLFGTKFESYINNPTNRFKKDNDITKEYSYLFKQEA